MMKIPQVDLSAFYKTHENEILEIIRQVLTSGWYILGEKVATFEKEFATFCGTQHAVGVANGTDAIELALRAVGISQGELVATVSHTAVATIAAIERIGLFQYMWISILIVTRCVHKVCSQHLRLLQTGTMETVR